MEALNNSLKILNDWLKSQDLRISLAVIGRYAFYLSGFKSVATLDIDTVTPIEDRIFEKINAIGVERGMKTDWLNDNAESMPLPDGFQERLLPAKGFSNIEIRYASRIDLIALKSAAYVGRGKDDPKDYQDLLLLEPTKTEMAAAEAFIRRYFSPPTLKFQREFEESVNELRNLAKK